jgi:formate-nitrite transporter family protein
MTDKATAAQETDKIAEEAVERTSPPGRVVYEAIYREGEHESERTLTALAWSGLAAGLSMGFSFLMEGLLRDYLPPGHWQAAIAKFGYGIGFLIVILGRQQLFTKNTLTVMLPLLAKKKISLLKTVARLWVVVLVTNLAGAFAFAWLMGHTNICSEDIRAQFSTMAKEALDMTFVTGLLRAIVAGWIIALMIWLLPFAETSHIWIIIFLAYLIGIGHLPHIIAGTVPSIYGVFEGTVPFGQWLWHFFVPVSVGNTVGGVTVVAMVAHAEFVNESKLKAGNRKK